MDIINPLEPQLNVSYNLNTRTLGMLQERCRQTLSKLEELKEGEEAVNSKFKISEPTKFIPAIS